MAFLTYTLQWDDGEGNTYTVQRSGGIVRNGVASIERGDILKPDPEIDGRTAYLEESQREFAANVARLIFDELRIRVKAGLPDPDNPTNKDWAKLSDDAYEALCAELDRAVKAA